MTRPAWRDLLERCGLHVLEDTAAHHGPPVLAAIRAVAGYEVRPAATIPLASPDAAAELDRAWHLHAADTSLHDAGEVAEFLILPPDSRATDPGWVPVRDTNPGNLPSRIAEATGSPECITVSLDGRRLCAVSEEEYDYWVVRHTFG
ncbi:hypothetical protein OQI_26300 [Streptomyces pharetrae CZA14]|uniref:Uncharacterized protein n=1 Tax=Streptomyces pharetrae CZA14 TaxID=1144883 RepID=A0ABX3YD04_9ACTN|nr:hypothetical protein OQI_26300 [Streptomyces pharetrae CZA14]